MLRKFVLATAIVAATGSLALAQSSPSPKNTTGPGVNSTVSTPTNPSAASATGDTNAKPGGKMSQSSMTKNKKNKMSESGMKKGKSMTTGSGMQKNANPATNEENAKYK